MCEKTEAQSNNKIQFILSESCNKSAEKKQRSLNTYYSDDVFEKQKYLNLRKANKQAKFQGHSVLNYIPGIHTRN